MTSDIITIYDVSSLWISSRLTGISYTRKGNLENMMYKSKELESVFYEVENPGKKTEIYGCIYRHPCMDADLFNEYLEKL